MLNGKKIIINKEFINKIEAEITDTEIEDLIEFLLNDDVVININDNDLEDKIKWTKRLIIELKGKLKEKKIKFINFEEKIINKGEPGYEEINNFNE